MSTSAAHGLTSISRQRVPSTDSVGVFGSVPMVAVSSSRLPVHALVRGLHTRLRVALHARMLFPSVTIGRLAPCRFHLMQYGPNSRVWWRSPSAWKYRTICGRAIQRTAEVTASLDYFQTGETGRNVNTCKRVLPLLRRNLELRFDECSRGPSSGRPGPMHTAPITPRRGSSHPMPCQISPCWPVVMKRVG